MQIRLSLINPWLSGHGGDPRVFIAGEEDLRFNLPESQRKFSSARSKGFSQQELHSYIGNAYEVSLRFVQARRCPNSWIGCAVPCCTLA